MSPQNYNDTLQNQKLEDIFLLLLENQHRLTDINDQIKKNNFQINGVESIHSHQSKHRRRKQRKRRRQFRDNTKIFEGPLVNYLHAPVTRNNSASIMIESDRKASQDNNNNNNNNKKDLWLSLIYIILGKDYFDRVRGLRKKKIVILNVGGVRFEVGLALVSVCLNILLFVCFVLVSFFCDCLFV